MQEQHTQEQQLQPQQQSAPQASILEKAMQKITAMQQNGELVTPKNYSPENALRSAWLVIQQTVDLSKRPALEVCTPASIANALLSMVLQGLNPDKKQCYFIVYGNKLEMQKSYFGQLAISKRVAGVKEAVGIPIYEGDIFKYQIDIKSGTKTVTEHEQDFMNIDVSKLKGAYAVVQYENGRTEYEIMTMQQIRASWEQGKAKGDSPAHKKFPDQMACKTVINRALKIPVNSSDDESLFGDTAGIAGMQAKADADLSIDENANTGETIGFDDDVQTQEQPEQPALEAAAEMPEQPAPNMEQPQTANQTNMFSGPAQNGRGF